MTEADIIAAAQAHRRIAFAASPMFAALGQGLSIAVYYVAFIEQGLHWRVADPSFVYSFVLLPLVVAFVSAVMLLRLSKPLPAQRTFAEYPMASVPVDIRWDASGIEFGLYGADWTEWRRFRRWYVSNGTMLIFFSWNGYLTLPDRAFADDELDAMRRYLEGAGVPEACSGGWM